MHSYSYILLYDIKIYHTYNLRRRSWSEVMHGIIEENNLNKQSRSLPLAFEIPLRVLSNPIKIQDGTHFLYL